MLGKRQRGDDRNSLLLLTPRLHASNIAARHRKKTVTFMYPPWRQLTRICGVITNNSLSHSLAHRSLRVWKGKSTHGGEDETPKLKRRRQQNIRKRNFTGTHASHLSTSMSPVKCFRARPVCRASTSACCRRT